MKPAFYESLDKIPEADRSDYKLVTETGSPNLNKYVLDLDPQHPVAQKNTELLGEKSNRDAVQAAAVQTAVARQDAEITNLKSQLQTAQSNTGLPPGHIAVPSDTLTQLNNYKGLGEFDAVKVKVEEHGTLKEQTESASRKTMFAEIAKAKGFDPEVFADLAEEIGLFPNLETKKTTDAKGVETTDYFVKGKNAEGADTSTAIEAFAKNDPKFKKFERSLFLSEADRKKVPIPNQSHGGPPVDQAAGKSYVNSNYKRPDKKDKE